MIEIVFIPKAVKEGKFSGSITLLKPSFKQRYEMFSAIGLKINQDQNGKAEMAGDTNHFDLIAKSVEYTKQFYKKVELKNVETGQEFTSFDDLTYESECDDILSEIANLYMGGFKLGKTSPTT